MTTTKLSFLAPILLCLIVAGAHASTVTVGTCTTNYISFSTIQSAVNAVPAGSTVQICPGTYPEQVLINKKITLKGIASNGSNAVVIVPPAGGLVPNATSTYPIQTENGPVIAYIEAMVLVQNTTATIEDITVDGTGNNTICGQDPIGIFFQNADGTVTRSNVLHIQVINGFGCQGGLGIYVESGSTLSNGQPNPSAAANSDVTISDNDVQDYDKNGITANGDGSNVKVTISSNTVIGAGAVPDNAQNGIQLWGANNSSVTDNIVEGDYYVPATYAAAGVLVLQSLSPTISGNDITNTQVGIYLESINPGDTNNATVNNNVITATHDFDAIVFCANNSTATGNRINVADEAGFGVYECGDASPSNSITGNTVSGACVGILTGPPATGATTPNTYYNVGNQVGASCTNALVKKHGGQKLMPGANPAR